jgi:hypothetical protein
MKTRTFRNIFIVLLSIILIIGMTACGSGGSTGSSDAGFSTTTNGGYEVGEQSGFILDYGKYSDVDWSTKPTFKIGFAWMSATDVLGSMYERAVAYACDVFHCEFQFVEWDLSSTTFVGDATENICQAGCDGLVSGMVDAATVEACNKYQVYFVGSLNQMNDELLSIASQSEYFCGNVIDDDYLSCYNEIVALYEAGCRNILWTAGQPGQTQADIRSSGFEDACAQYPDLNVVTTIRSTSTDMSTTVTGIESAIAAYPELDGIALGNGIDITATLYANGADKKVKVATTDLCTSYSDLFTDEILVYTATDQYPTECIAFTLLYNALTGHPILSDTSEQVYRQFLEIHNYEEYANMYNLSFLNIFPYSAEQLLDLCVEFNPDADEDLYTQYGEEYTIENLTSWNTKYLEETTADGRV